MCFSITQSYLEDWDYLAQIKYLYAISWDNLYLGFAWFWISLLSYRDQLISQKADLECICKANIQSNFGRSNSPVSNTRGRLNSSIGPGNFPIHLMLKYTPGSNSDGSNSRTQSTVRRAFFHVKTLWWLEPNISFHESVTRLIKVHYYFHKRSVTMMISPLGYLTDERNAWSN